MDPNRRGFDDTRLTTGRGAGTRRGLLGLLAAIPLLAAAASPPDADAQTAGERRGKRNRRGCPEGRVRIDGRCAPPANDACSASAVCDPFTTLDDDGGNSAACLHGYGGDVCQILPVCRSNADCASDEVCALLDCGGGLDRCLRMCGDRAVG